MGTRNLTMVIHDGETKIAQYGQWDGYPSGQGCTVLAFLHRLQYPTVNKRFMAKLKRLRFIDDEKQKEIDTWLKTIGVTNGWMNMDQSDLYHKQYPLLTRDNGAQILKLVYDQKGRGPIWIHDSSDFVTDGLFNEWTYVIDFDRQVLEVYHGFGKTMPPEDSRFYKQIVEAEAEFKEMVESWDKKAKLMSDAGVKMETIEKKIGRRPYVPDTSYYLQLMHTFDLNNIPTEEEFLAILEPEEEEA